MFRSILSVFLGFVLMMILVMTYQVALFLLFPDAFPMPDEDGTVPTASMSVPFTLLLLALDFATGLFAGYFTAAVAGRDEKRHATMLATVVLILGFVTLATRFGEEPVMYAIVRSIGVPVVVYLGGALRARQKTPNTPSEEPSS